MLRHQAVRVVRCCCAYGDAKPPSVTGKWSVAASGQSCNDLAVFVFGEGPQGLGCHVADTANREGSLRGSGVVGCLADRDDVVPAHGEVERLQLRAIAVQDFLVCVETVRALL